MKTKKSKKGMKLKTRITIFFCLITFIVLCISMLINGLFGYVMMKMDVIEINRNIPGIITLILFMFASVLISMIFYLLMCNLPLTPVESLVTGMEQLKEGKYDTRIQLGESASGKRLTETFNTLAEELAQTEMLRSDFVNNFSHEFKTPIVSILGFARVLNNCDIEEERKKEYLTAIEEEAERLALMANSVLLMTKVENQTILTDVKEYNVSEQIRNCILLKEKSWTDKNLSLNLDFLEYNIVGNEDLLTHLWNNLIDNAIKYSYNNQELKIDILEEDNNLIFKITNKGVKIPPEEKEKIFNKFYQVDKSHSSKGNGIGLSICKKVVSLHKGEIYLEDSIDKTVFVVKLPKTQ